jgi:hypothetical protein
MIRNWLSGIQTIGRSMRGIQRFTVKGTFTYNEGTGEFKSKLEIR